MTLKDRVNKKHPFLWRIQMLAKQLIGLFCCFILASCSPNDLLEISKNDQVCEPTHTIKPTSASVSSAGIFSLTDSKSNYLYDLRNSTWVCNAPSAPIINSFKEVDAQLILRSIKSEKNKISHLIEQRIEFNQTLDLRSFVNDSCQKVGLSYLFELRGTTDEEIFGCQINTNIESAIMWQKSAKSPTVKVAHLPIYQPFINQILSSLESRN
tara:strand:+ start:153 stop:785 length:633 start_codon:yes stop_codon:yes gene_type:complete